MLHTRKPVKTNPSTNFKHHFQHWCNQKLNPLVQKSETRKMNQFSKETVFFFTFCSSFLLFVFLYIFFIFLYFLSWFIYYMQSEIRKWSWADVVFFAYAQCVLLRCSADYLFPDFHCRFPFPVPHSPVLLLVTSRAIKSNAFTKNRSIVSPRPCKWKMEMP